MYTVMENREILYTLMNIKDKRCKHDTPERMSNYIYLELYLALIIMRHQWYI